MSAGREAGTSFPEGRRSMGGVMVIINTRGAVMGCQALSTEFTYPLSPSCEVDTLVTPISQMRKPRQKQLFPPTWVEQRNLKPGSHAAESVV